MDDQTSRLQLLSKEWLVQQQAFDKYEQYSLVIKLVAVATVLLIRCLGTPGSIIPFLAVLLFWLTEAIWKTFQQRIYQRLLQLESALHENDPAPADPMTFNCEFEQQRPGLLGLIGEYSRSGLTPTTMVTYLILIAIVAIAALLF